MRGGVLVDFTLSGKEFLFLCFAAGATQVYGVENAFSDINANDMSSEIRRVHNSLEKKNYIESDFDGNSVINQKLLDTVRVCANYSTLVMLNSSRKGSFITANYYWGTDTLIKAYKEKDDYILSSLPKELFTKDLLSNISFRTCSEFEEDYEIMFKQNDLEQIKQNLQSGKREEAISQINEKANANLTEVLISALEANEDFYSIAAIDNKGMESIDTIMIIDTDKGALILQPQIVDLENAVKIVSCTHNELNSLINRFIEKITE